MSCGDCIKGVVKIAQSVAGLGLADNGVIQHRRDICRECPHATRNQSRLNRPTKGLTNLSRCSLCNCFIAAKTKLRSEQCPAGKW